MRPVGYSISYDLDGGTVATANPTSYNVESGDITLNNPTKEGYEFTGWTGSNGYSPSKSVTIQSGKTGDLSFTANWELKTYSITYNLDGGTATGNPATYNQFTETFTLVNPTRSEYEFVGWTGSNGSTPQKTVIITKGTTEDLTYTANWRPDYYILYWDEPLSTHGDFLEEYTIYENKYSDKDYWKTISFTKSDGTYFDANPYIAGSYRIKDSFIAFRMVSDKYALSQIKIWNEYKYEYISSSTSDSDNCIVALSTIPSNDLRIEPGQKIKVTVKKDTGPIWILEFTVED